MVGRANFGKWRKEKMKVCLVVIGIIRVFVGSTILRIILYS